MSKSIEFFGSLQSPYCYFALDRLDTIKRELGVIINMRPVLPGVIRIPDAYAKRSVMEQSYFIKDVERTAAFLDLPFAEAKPSPVNWKKGSLWIAEAEQGRVKRLYNMLYQSHLQGKEYPFYSGLMRLTWTGRPTHWDSEEHLAACLTNAGLPKGFLRQSEELLPEADTYFAENQKAMNDSGHWGVPVVSFSGEPFYGQDRLDQLRWRIENSTKM